MSKRMRAFGPAVHNRRKRSRQGIPSYFTGSVPVAGLVLGCAWTVYTNVFGANVYPSVNRAAYEPPAVKNPTVVAARTVRPAFNEIFASLPQQSLVIPAPENVASSLMFNERFAAASPQGEPPRSVEPRPVEAAKLADASPAAEVPKAMQTSKPKVSAPATRLALATAPKEAEARLTEAKLTAAT